MAPLYVVIVFMGSSKNYIRKMSNETISLAEISKWYIYTLATWRENFEGGH